MRLNALQQSAAQESLHMVCHDVDCAAGRFLDGETDGLTMQGLTTDGLTMQGLTTNLDGKWSLRLYRARVPKVTSRNSICTSTRVT